MKDVVAAAVRLALGSARISVLAAFKNRHQCSGWTSNHAQCRRRVGPMDRDCWQHVEKPATKKPHMMRFLRYGPMLNAAELKARGAPPVIEDDVSANSKPRSKP